MRVVATFHPSSSVSSSLKCSLIADSELEHLIVAATDRLEVFSLQEDALKPECSLAIWGRVVTMRAVPAEGGRHSNILVMTDHPDPRLILLGYAVQDGVPALVTLDHRSLSDRAARPAEFLMDLQIDPAGELAIASCYAGKLRVVPFKKGRIASDFDVSLPEINILGFAFLHTGGRAKTLAILHLDYQQRLQLLCRDVELEELELSELQTSLLPTTLLSSSVFPVLDALPALVAVPPHEADDEGGHRGGLLLVGGKKFVFYEHLTQESQNSRKMKQVRLKKRLSSASEAEMNKGKVKELEREARKYKPQASVKWPWGTVTAWCPVDDDGRRYLVGDAYGCLAMLAFDEREGLTLIPLGETSPATTLSYLSAQVVYLGSHAGDSQLLRIHPNPLSEVDSDTLPIPSGVSTVPPPSLKGKGKETALDEEFPTGRDGRIVRTKGKFVEVLKSYDNIAPIVDAILADIDESGQPQIVTCSGGRNTGSLRVIRAEAVFQALAKLDGFSGVTDMWPVRSRFEATVDTHLVVSTLRQTFVFAFDDRDTVTHVESMDSFVADLPTFAVGNMPKRQVTAAGSSYVDSSLIVQVTPEGVNLVEYNVPTQSFRREDSWKPMGEKMVGREVVAASVNASQILLAVHGGCIAVLNLSPDDKIQLFGWRQFAEEVSAVSCAPFDRSKRFSQYAAAAFWGSNKVQILSIKDQKTALETLCEVALPALPRSVLLHNFGTGLRSSEPDFHPHLLVGLADGTLATYPFLLKAKALGDRKISSLGNAPVSLATCEAEGETVVLASAARAAILRWDRQGIRSSPVSVKHVVKAAALHSEAYPSGLLLATSSTISIGNVRGVDKAQIRTIPLGLENPRRVAYHPNAQVFGLACSRVTPPRLGSDEDTIGCFKLLDGHSFQQQHNFECNALEEVSAVLAVTQFSAKDPDVFSVGTVTVRPEESEPSLGRVLLFAITPPNAIGARSLVLKASQEVQGCVYALASVRGSLIAAAVNTSIVLFNARESLLEDGLPISLEKVTEWNHNYFVTTLVADGDYLIAGDAISSVSVVKVSEDGSKLEAVARDYSPLWPTAIASTGNGVIGANSDCNLFSFRLQMNQPMARLEKEGVYHLDDAVNKIIPGSLTTPETSGERVVQPQHVFFTSTGRIGAIVELENETSLHMTALQRNMATAIVGPGDANHTTWRAPAGKRGHTDAESAYGFLDGDFLERFLTHPRPEELLEGEMEAEKIEMPLERVKDVLVQLQGLH